MKKHEWKLGLTRRGKHYYRDTCVHCKIQRWVLMETTLYAAPRGFAREKPIWSTFKPGCVAHSKKPVTR